MTRAPRNSVRDRPAKWKLLLRRQRRLVRPAGWVAFGLAVVVALVVTFHSAAPGGSLATMRERLGTVTASLGFRVRHVVIEGRANTPEPLLRSAIGINPGDPILGFSVEQARARIETIPWVDHATVERRLPGTIVVFLQERRPFAIWQNHGKFVLIDRAGQVVTNQDVSQFQHLPLVVGQGAPEAAAALLDALNERPALAAKVVAGVRVAQRRWNLRMTSGADVLLPEGHEIVALDRLMQLQQDHAILDRPLIAIDMRLPDRLVVRPRPEPHSDAAQGGRLPTPPASAPTVAVSAKKNM